MSDQVTMRGNIGTDPELTTIKNGASMLKFRLASHESKRDPETGGWVDGPTSWYTVTAFRELADNAAASFSNGDHIIVFGKISIRQFDRNEGGTGISAEVEAFTMAHDLKYGTSQFTRVVKKSGRDRHAGNERQEHRGAGEARDPWASEDGEAA